jgi:hypothetical protein
MLRNPIFLKSVAVFFAFEILFNAMSPTISWALTAGPTAPEYSSFEPVDTTDIVNLVTGNLIYNIPLLEVPGPSGGYPLSMSYHSGIMPNEQSSWVGLGFTLNPGAINRTVNAYADDQLGAKRVRVDYNSGGERSTFGAGVGLPGAGFGLSVSNDTYLGVGVGSNFYASLFSVGGTFNKSRLGVSASVSAGADGYGGSNLKAGAGLSVGKAEQEAKGLGYNLGIQTNFENVSFKVGSNPADVSISSRGLKPSMSAAGMQMNQVSSNAGRVKHNGWGITIPIPLGKSGLFLNLSYNYVRYHSYENTNVSVIGALHAKDVVGKNRDQWAFDSYALLDPDQAGGIIRNHDPEKSKGGSFPAYDSYSVSAQGLSGSIQPYIFENGNLFRQNKKRQNSSTEYEIKYEQTGSNFSKPVNFRFKNDFSNTFGYSKTEMYLNEGQISFATPTDGLTPNEGINLPTQHLAGSKHIEWFTNQQIRDGIAKERGFVDYKPSSERELSKGTFSIASQIGGIMITNEDGITYHYSLPIYAYNEFSKAFQSGKVNDVYQTNRNNEPYAYTWLLTAVTGPDFVDRGTDNTDLPNGLADQHDWGYWVKFEYDLHANQYLWRNPVVGTHKDIDTNIEFYSYGSKELYYLNSISTKTHIAVFEKSERLDGKGVTNQLVGGFQPQTYSAPYEIPDCDPTECTDSDPRICADYCTGYTQQTVYPQSTLKRIRPVKYIFSDDGGSYSFEKKSKLWNQMISPSNS